MEILCLKYSDGEPTNEFTCLHTLHSAKLTRNNLYLPIFSFLLQSKCFSRSIHTDLAVGILTRLYSGRGEKSATTSAKDKATG